VAKYYYYPGWHEPGPTLEAIVNQAAWDSLPADLQHILTVAARAANQDMLDQYTALNNRALTDLVDNHGVQVRKLPNDVLKQLKIISAQVLTELSEASPLAKEIHDSFIAYQKGVTDYHHISEQAYLEARDL
jgi:TRAP-type mannitol/chloroaromatic compound transport system substrate-binding protein